MALRKKSSRIKRRTPKPTKPLAPKPPMVAPGSSPFAYKDRLVFTGLPCRTLDDMSEAEIRAIEQQYGMPVRPRDKVT